MSRWIIVFAAVCALLNPVIAFAAINFDLAAAYLDPMLFVRVITTPLWVWFGMPMFFLTDSIGWYLLPPLIMRRLARRWNFSYATTITGLSWIYSLIGHGGLFVFLGGYVWLVAAGGSPEEFTAGAKLAYDWIWGVVNNSVGCLLFGFMAFGLGTQGRWAAMTLQLLTSVLMGASAISQSLGTLFDQPLLLTSASTITTPLYLLLFPVAVVSYAWQIPAHKYQAARA
jgi:hypothetical protein